MPTLRTDKMENKYRQYRADCKDSTICNLCKEGAIISFKYWKIIENDFPYDTIAEKHDIIIPTRHTKESDLTLAEQAEFKEIKATFINAHPEYHYIMEATEKNKSIPNHFHLHLITLKS